MKTTGQKISIYNGTDGILQPGNIVLIKGGKGYIANNLDTNVTKYPLGYVLNTINESQIGEVLLEGTIDGINSERFGEASTILYLGETGNIITSAPTTTIILGSVIKSNEVFGSIYFKVILPAGSGSGPSTQVNSDWNATSGVAEILNKPTITPITPSALTKTDDTNVTLTLGGSPTNALLQAISLTLGWTGTLADSRIASASTWNAKQDTITGAASTITSSNLTGSRVLVSNGGGKVDVSAVTTTEVGYLVGVTSDIQTQLNAKQDTLSLTTTGTTGAATLVGSTLNIPLYSSGATSFLCANHLANTIAASTTSYNGFISGAFVTAANEYTRNFLIPVASTAGNYSIQTITTQPATGALIFTIRKNSVDTAITITVPAGSAGAISTTATTVAFSALDRISIKVQNLATTASAQITHQSIRMTI